jgi:hypothetical protein
VWHKIKHELQKHVQNITSRQLMETAIRNIIYEEDYHLETHNCLLGNDVRLRAKQSDQSLQYIFGH